MLNVRFFVAGTVVTKGNHDAFPVSRGRCDKCGGSAGGKCGRRNCFNGILVGTVITDSKGDELKTWEALVRTHAISARNAGGDRVVAKPGALSVSMIFVFERPASHWTTKGALSTEGQRHPIPTVKPDWDKVSRAAADALTGSLVEDDSQIAIANVAKVYATPGQHAGVAIAARQIHESDAWVTLMLDALGVRSVSSTQAVLF